MAKHIAELPTETPRSLPRHRAGEVRRAARRRPPRAGWGRRPRLLAAALASAVAVPLTLHVASAALRDAVVVDDDFARTLATGWGDAGTGGAWSVSAPGQASVAGGAGVLALQPGRGVQAFLAATAVRDADAAATFSTQTLPAGNGLYTELMLRRQADGSAYRVLARVTASGDVRLGVTRNRGGSTTVLARETATAVTVTPGSEVVVEGEVSATDPVVVRARVRPVGTAPAGWAATARDGAADRIATAGSIGISTYLSSHSGPITARVGHLHAETVDADAETPPAPQPPVPSAPVPTPSASKPAPSPDPTPSADPPAAPAPGVPAGERASATAGAPVVGTTRYPVPAGAVVVSPSGADGAAGTADAPLRTVARAIAVARAGGTVVLRGGIYHENVTVPAGKRLVLQSYPGEAVWFDGSTPVRSWTADGGAWVHDGWTPFDPASCYSPGNCPTGAANQFVSPQHPMAGNPDQVFFDGVQQRQVGSRGEVGPGTFYVDAGAKRLYVGSDPRQHDVAASDLSEAVTLRADGSVLRGVGVRRYATSLARPAAVRLQASGLTVEDVTVVDNAAIGIAVSGTGATLRQVTTSRNGIMGVGGHHADGLTVTGLRSEGNNTEHFNMAPVSGGLKLTVSRNVRIDASVFARNEGPGVWLDESVYDAVVTRSDMVGNAGHGLSFEISAKGLFGDLLVLDNGGNGFKLNNSEGVEVWNSTVLGNGRAIWAIQDPRRGDDPSVAGHDKRRPQPDPQMSWRTGAIRVVNSVLGAPKASTSCVLCVEDGTHQRSAAQMGITVEGVLFARTSPGNPRWLVVWSKGPGNPATYTDLDAFVAATGQGKGSAGVETPGQVRHGRGVAVAAPGLEPRPLPGDVADTLRRQAGEKHVGAWE